MEVISEIICSRNTVITIIHSKKRDLLLSDICFGEIGYYTYPILVIRQERAGVGIG